MTAILENELSCIADRPWAPNFAREFELVVAANAFEASAKGAFVSETQMSARIASRCLPLDGDVEERFLGIVSAPHHQVLKAELDKLKRLPRGHWLIAERAGKFDSWVSNGMGAARTQSGEKFIHSRPDAALLNFTAVYASIWGMPAYLLRTRIENEILTHSLAMSQIQIGDVFKKRLVGGRPSTIVLTKREQGYFTGGGDGYHLRITRRGVKASAKIISSAELARLLGIARVLPPQYIDVDNVIRLKSLTERRSERMQALWDQMTSAATSAERHNVAARCFDQADHVDFSNWGSKAPFNVDGDLLFRHAYVDGADGARTATHIFAAHFWPNADQIVSASITALESPPCLGLT